MYSRGRDFCLLLLIRHADCACLINMIYFILSFCDWVRHKHILNIYLDYVFDHIWTFVSPSNATNESNSTLAPFFSLSYELRSVSYIDSISFQFDFIPDSDIHFRKKNTHILPFSHRVCLVDNPLIKLNPGHISENTKASLWEWAKLLIFVVIIEWNENEKHISRIDAVHHRTKPVGIRFESWIKMYKIIYFRSVPFPKWKN